MKTPDELKESRRKAHARIRQRSYYQRHRSEILQKKAAHDLLLRYGLLKQNSYNAAIRGEKQDGV